MIKELKNKIMEVYWNIAIVEKTGDLQSDLKNAHWIKHNYKDGWFADPFILDYNDEEIEVLVEEFFYKTKKGRISKLVINRETYELKNIRCLLQLPTHLSFPAIYRHNGEIYVYPENSENGNITIYKLNSDHTDLTPINVLCDQPLTDAIIEHIEGKTYIFTTLRDEPNGNLLSIYQIDQIPIYESQSANAILVKQVRLPNKSARNAGNIIEIGNKTYKVSQDCNEYYGKGLIFFEMDGLDNLVEAFRHYTKGKIIGCHTYNEYKGLGVIDGKKYKHHWIANLLHKLNHL